MNVRNQAIAMSAQSQNVANAVLQQVFPLFLTKEGFYAMYMFGAINVVLFAFVWFFIVETKNVPLNRSILSLVEQIMLRMRTSTSRLLRRWMRVNLQQLCPSPSARRKLSRIIKYR
jgi:hypothetical protein